jgi:hypothetical protein
LERIRGAVSLTHLDYYLDEYTFRFNRRTSGSLDDLVHFFFAEEL